jgi:hypothetical protein
MDYLEEIKTKIEKCERNCKYSEDPIENYEKMIYRYPSLTDNNVSTLLRVYKKTGSRDAKDIIFKCHLKDVYETCKDETGAKLDLVSEGNIVLYNLIDSFLDETEYVYFKGYLKIKIKSLYSSLSKQNEQSLDSEISLNKLKVLEDKDIDLTECARDSKLIRPRLSNEEARANDFLFITMFNRDSKNCISEYKKELINLYYGVNGKERHSNKELSDELKQNYNFLSRKRCDALYVLRYVLKKEDYDNIF